MEDIQININQVKTVEDVRRQIREKREIPIYRQTSMFQGNMLNDHETISNIFSKFDLEKEFVFYLVITGDEDQPFEVKIKYTYHVSIYVAVTI